MKSLILFIILTLTSILFSRELFVKGFYEKGYDKPFTLTWKISYNVNNTINFYLNNKPKAIVFLDNFGNPIKLIKFLPYQGKVKELKITNKKSIQYEIANALIPFATALNSYEYRNLKKSLIISKHSFEIIEGQK